MAKILGICGSVRIGATDFALREALKEAEKIPGIETEIWSVRGKKISPCVHCDACIRNNSMCIIKDDIKELEEKFINADGFIIASPVYDMSITAQLAAVMNRLRPNYLVYPGKLKYKPGGAVATGGTRHGGQEFALQTILNFYLMHEMFAVGGLGGCYNGGKIWSKDNKAQGAIDDIVGLDTVRKLGKAIGEATIVSFEGRKKWEEIAHQSNISTESNSPLLDH
jgi:multimeric flavodoxin WrbA